MKKRTATEKTLNPEMLAGAGIEGSSTTPSVEEGYSHSISDFMEKNYRRLSRWCDSRWNGQRQDVMHEAAVIAIERRYEYMTFSLFSSHSREAARNLQVARWTHDAEKTIILPPTERAAERLDAHHATAQADEPAFTAGEMKTARRLLRAEKRGQPCLWVGVGK
jgi:DNA-directed RNA polymerase specialized sigma24 family protein